MLDTGQLERLNNRSHYYPNKRIAEKEFSRMVLALNSYLVAEKPRLMQPIGEMVERVDALAARSFAIEWTLGHVLSDLKKIERRERLLAAVAVESEPAPGALPERAEAQ